MQTALSDLKVKVGKYADLADMEDVTATKHGRPTATQTMLRRWNP